MSNVFCVSLVSQVAKLIQHNGLATASWLGKVVKLANFIKKIRRV